MENSAAWSTTTRDVRIARRPALLHGVVILANSTGGGATVYAGQDASARKIGTFQGVEDVSKQIRFSPPLECEGGIYVGGCSHVDEFLVHWSPM